MEHWTPVTGKKKKTRRGWEEPTPEPEEPLTFDPREPSPGGGVEETKEEAPPFLSTPKGLTEYPPLPGQELKVDPAPSSSHSRSSSQSDSDSSDSSTMSSEESRLGKNPPPQLPNDKKYYNVWWMRFAAYGGMHGFRPALKAEKEDDLPDTEEEKPNETKEQKAARKRNLLAMFAFTTALPATLMEIIYLAQTVDWPTGLCWMVVAALFAKFRPMDLITRVEVQQDMSLIHMGDKEHPSTLFAQIAEIKSRC